MPGPVYCRLKEVNIDQIIKIIRDRNNYSEPENIRAKQIETPKGIVEGGRFTGMSSQPKVDLSARELRRFVDLLLEKGKTFVTSDGDKLVLWKIIREHHDDPGRKKKDPADISEIEKGIGKKPSKLGKGHRKFCENPNHFPMKTKAEQFEISVKSKKKKTSGRSKKIDRGKFMTDTAKSKVVKKATKKAILSATESIIAKPVADSDIGISLQFLVSEEPSDQANSLENVAQNENKVLHQEKETKTDVKTLNIELAFREAVEFLPETPNEIQAKEATDVPGISAVAISEKPDLMANSQCLPLSTEQRMKQRKAVRLAKDAEKIVSEVFSKAQILGYELIKIDEVKPFKGQPREVFSAEALERLTRSIIACGQRQLIIVMPIDEPPFKWELVDGERRYRASIIAGKIHIHACIVSPMEKREQFLYSFLANSARENSTELEEARSLQRIKDDFGFNDVQLSKIIPKDNFWIGRRLALLRLHPEVQVMIQPVNGNSNKLSLAVANFLTQIKVQDEQLRMAKVISEKKMNVFEARNFIRAEIRNNGIPARTRKRPSDDYVKFRGLIERIGRDAGFFLAMKEEQFQEMLARRKPNEVNNLVEEAEKKIEILDKLRSRIMSRPL
jgi:ParB family transcriptional regulator, chromosome partitioning protein